MGVLIYPCKIKERVGNLDDEKEFDEDVLRIDGDFIIEPFDGGYYTYESAKPQISSTYSEYGDFLSCLAEFGFCDFSITLGSCGTDNVASYKCAEIMLEEFEGHLSDAKKHIYKRFGKEYGEYIWWLYKEFIGVLKECIKLQGVVRFH